MLNVCLFLIVQTSERSWDQRQTNSGSSENGWSSTESKQQTQKSLEEFRFSLVQFQWAGNEVKSRRRTNQNSLKHVMLFSLCWPSVRGQSSGHVVVRPDLKNTTLQRTVENERRFVFRVKVESEKSVKSQWKVSDEQKLNPRWRRSTTATGTGGGVTVGSQGSLTIYPINLSTWLLYCKVTQYCVVYTQYFDAVFHFLDSKIGGRGPGRWRWRLTSLCVSVGRENI